MYEELKIMKKIFKNKSIKILITSLLCGLICGCINASAMENSEQKQSQEYNRKSNATFNFKNAMDMQCFFEQAALAQKLSINANTMKNKNIDLNKTINLAEINTNSSNEQKTTQNRNKNEIFEEEKIYENNEFTKTEEDYENQDKDIKEKYDAFIKHYNEFKEKDKIFMSLEEIKPYYEILIKKYQDLYYKIPKNNINYSEIIKDRE